MRIGIVLALLTGAALLPAADADAARWQMTYNQAVRESRDFARELCRQDAECLGYGVGQCYRRSLSRFSCNVGTFYPGAEPGEELECQVILHWGVKRGGTIVLKNYGRPRCRATQP